MEVCFKDFKLEAIDFIAVLYKDYFNEEENASWTLDTAKRRLNQLLDRVDTIAFLLEKNSRIIGFFIGQLVQFDDGLVFELLELLVLKKDQNQGYGSILLKKAMTEALNQNAFMIQLTAIKDESHDYFYNIKHGFTDAKNNIWKSRIL